MAAGGFVKLWRSALDNPVLRGDSAAALLFYHSILRAAWRPTPWDVAGEVTTLQPGEFFASWSNLAEATGLSVKRLRRAAAKLEAAGMVAFRPRANRGHLITVCNYREYQGSGPGQGQTEGTTEGMAEGTTKGTTEGTLNKKQDAKKAEGSPHAAGARDGDVVIPAELRTSPEFAEVWEEWLGYRREHRWTVKPAWRRRSLELLSEYGPTAAVDALRKSMAQGWQSVHPERTNTSRRREVVPDVPDHDGPDPTERHLETVRQIAESGGHEELVVAVRDLAGRASDMSPKALDAECERVEEKFAGELAQLRGRPPGCPKLSPWAL